MPQLTPIQIKDITKAYFNECLKRFDTYKERHETNRWGLPSSTYEERPDGMSIEQAVAKIVAPFVESQDDIHSGEYMFQMNDHVIASNGIDAIERESNSYKMLASGMRRIRNEFEHQVQQHANAEIEPTINDDWFKDESIPVVSQSMSSPENSESVSEDLSVLYQRYLNEMESSITAKTLDKKRKALRTWLDLMGDVQVQAINKSKARDFKGFIVRIPINASVRYPNKPLKELLDTDSRKLSSKSVNNYLTDMGSFFKWAINNGYYESDNPFTGLQLSITQNNQADRDPFSDQQLSALFNSTIYKGCKSQGRRYEEGREVIKDKLYWIPQLMAI